MHEANRRHWDESAGYWEELRERDGLWRQCPTNPRLAFEGGAWETIISCCSDLAGKRVVVVGSGDNYAAFALAGAGAVVTSVDISEMQLEVARRRATELGLRIDFVRADAAGLDPLESAEFDLACSTNGFFVWIAHLDIVFDAVFRVLKRGGHYVFYDIHPFQRPWGSTDKRQTRSVEPQQSYWETGPQYDTEAKTYEFNWTIADLLNRLVERGFRLLRVKESPPKSSRFWEGHSYEESCRPDLTDWRVNARAALPVWLTVCAQKPHHRDER